MSTFTHSLLTFLLMTVLIACTAISPAAPTPAAACPFTEPTWAKPADDPAVLDPMSFGYYYLNEDHSIWASAWPSEDDPYFLHAGEEGNKMGWFRPAGAELDITGQRLDGEAPPLESEVPCCYPARFQATGLYFPTEGCWEVTARAADRKIIFIVWVRP
jgi:hypothetical protein